MSLKEEVEMLKLRANMPRDTENSHSTISPIEPFHIGDIWILDKRHPKTKDIIDMVQSVSRIG